MCSLRTTHIHCDLISHLIVNLIMISVLGIVG